MIRWRWPLAVAASEIFLGGLWLLIRPESLFLLLHIEPRDFSLWRAIGFLEVSQGFCTFFCSWKPVEYRGLALVPLLGRTLGAALWLWVSQVDWLPIPSFALIGLIVHQILWIPLLAAYLLSPLFRSER